ncbi:MAG: ABC transporter permease subunit [Candidatus Velamenicoccus archaeovorus]
MARDLATAHPRMLGTVFSKTLRDQRRSLLWWTLGFAGTVLLYSAFWPSIRDNAAELTRYVERMPEFMRNLIGDVDYGTAEGYIQSEVFSFLGPILLLVYAVGAGSRAIAGEEEAGSLDLLLSMPVRRARVLLDKFWAMLLPTFWLVFAMWLGLVAFGPAFDLRPGLEGFTAASLNLFLLAMAFGTIALATGAATGSKGLAVGVTSGIALVTFILNTLAPSVDWLEPYRVLSPFHYYAGGDPMLNGFAPAHAMVLAAITVVALGVALVAFDRRDLAAA